MHFPYLSTYCLAFKTWQLQLGTRYMHQMEIVNYTRNHTDQLAYHSIDYQWNSFCSLDRPRIRMKLLRVPFLGLGPGRLAWIDDAGKVDLCPHKPIWVTRGTIFTVLHKAEYLHQASRLQEMKSDLSSTIISH